MKGDFGELFGDLKTLFKLWFNPSSKPFFIIFFIQFPPWEKARVWRKLGIGLLHFNSSHKTCGITSYKVGTLILTFDFKALLVALDFYTKMGIFGINPRFVMCMRVG